MNDKVDYGRIAKFYLDHPDMLPSVFEVIDQTVNHYRRLIGHVGVSEEKLIKRVVELELALAPFVRLYDGFNHTHKEREGFDIPLYGLNGKYITIDDVIRAKRILEEEVSSV